MKKGTKIILIILLMAALVGVSVLNQNSFNTENEPLTNPNPEIFLDEDLNLQDSDQNEAETQSVQDSILKQEESKTKDQYSVDSNIEKKEDKKPAQIADEKKKEEQPVKAPDEEWKETTQAKEEKQPEAVITTEAIKQESVEVNSSEAAIDMPIEGQSSEAAIDTPIECQSSEAAIDMPTEGQNSEAAVTQSIPAPPSTDQTPSPEKTAARVKYIMSINKNITEDDAENLAKLFEQYASEREYLDVEVLMSIARLESGFKPNIDANYMGLMQVSLKYGEKAGYTREQLLDPYYNLAYACDILDDLNKKLNGSVSYILLGYNQGYYGLKSKIDSGAELDFKFAEKCYKYVNEIIALY